MGEGSGGAIITAAAAAIAITAATAAAVAGHHCHVTDARAEASAEGVVSSRDREQATQLCGYTARGTESLQRLVTCGYSTGDDSERPLQFLIYTLFDDLETQLISKTV